MHLKSPCVECVISDPTRSQNRRHTRVPRGSSIVVFAWQRLAFDRPVSSRPDRGPDCATLRVHARRAPESLQPWT
jgi:hypothetical protein